MKLSKLLLIGCFLLSGCSESITCTNCIDIEKQSIDINLLIDTKQDFFLLIGLNGCGACAQYYPIVDEAIKTYEVSIYYAEQSYFFASYPELKEVMLNLCLDNRLGFPLTCYFIDGIISDLEVGMLSAASLGTMLMNFIQQSMEE